MTDHNDQQKERLETVGQAALNMSHGIKNIVQSIRSGREMMDEALNRNNLDVARRTWGILGQSIQRMEKLSLDMLKFGKADPPSLRQCDLNRLVQSVVETIRPLADRQQITLATHLDADLESAMMDPDQIQDVIMNLLINALEAVPAQSGKVTFQTKFDPDRQQIMLRVSDNGPGIEDTEAVFKPFYTSKGNLNAGLGLTIAREIIIRHGGDLVAQSSPQGGTSFTVSLPCSQ